jgi:hypothetical protein
MAAGAALTLGQEEGHFYPGRLPTVKRAIYRAPPPPPPPPSTHAPRQPKTRTFIGESKGLAKLPENPSDLSLVVARTRGSGRTPRSGPSLVQATILAVTQSHVMAPNLPKRTWQVEGKARTMRGGREGGRGRGREGGRDRMKDEEAGQEGGSTRARRAVQPAVSSLGHSQSLPSWRFNPRTPSAQAAG